VSHYRDDSTCSFGVRGEIGPLSQQTDFRRSPHHRPFSFRILSRDPREDFGNDRVDIDSTVAVSAADDHAR
jgi:hypothetical protein